MSKALPSRANLEQLKKQAKELHKAYQAHENDARERIAAYLPRLAAQPTAPAQPNGPTKTPFTLSEAQFVLAREYGFSSWPKLKHYVDSLQAADATALDAPTDAQQPHEDPLEALKTAVLAGDAEEVKALLAQHPSLKDAIDEPLFFFDAPAIVVAKHNLDLVDVLLANGADINARSHWWAGGFGVLDDTSPETAAALIKRGAHLDIHAAAGLGMLDCVAAFVDQDPRLVNAKGGDGQRPLHFASTVEIIDFLLDHGAEIDARDIDHLGTPAQYKVREPTLCRHLIKRGAAVDIFMACALGDLDLVRSVLDADPTAIHARIGAGGYAPAPEAPGGHIYMYKLAPNHAPYQVARRLAPQAVYDLLLQRSPATLRLLAAFDRADAAAAKTLLAADPHLLSRLSPADRRVLADAAWDNNLGAVRVMLDVGFDPQALGGEQSTPLDRAAWHGFVDIVRLLLKHDPHPPLRQRNAHGATPLATCIHGSIHSWRKDGDHAAVAELLIAAGAPLPERAGGSDAVIAVLRRHGVSG